ncbi:hypothetical protein NC651_013615 [Populus alba x Populus x berolinensis]|nr:hypothetical protein NC651_013615 [Populus alba x Populus x berolinensis]
MVKDDGSLTTRNMKGKNVRRTGTTRTSQAQEVRKPCYHDPRPKQQQKEVVCTVTVSS